MKLLFQAEFTDMKRSLEQHKGDDHVTEELTKKLDELKAKLEKSEKEIEQLKIQDTENQEIIKKVEKGHKTNIEKVVIIIAF